ncbi:MAG: hypothetical protein U0892_00205 [Pirellulales bacterium]
MARVILTKNAIRIADPAVAPALIELCVGGALSLFAYGRWNELRSGWTAWLDPALANTNASSSTTDSASMSDTIGMSAAASMNNSAGMASLTMETAIDTFIPLVIGTCLFGIITLLACGYLLAGATQLLNQLRFGRMEHHSGVPGPIDSAEARAYDLFTNRAISRTSTFVPGLITRMFFGKSAYWIAPSAATLFATWERVTWRFFWFCLVMSIPAFLPEQWLTQSLQRFQNPDFTIPESALSAAEHVQTSLRWSIRYQLLYVSGAACTALTVAIFSLCSKPANICVTEHRSEHRQTGNPTDFFHLIEEQFRLLQRDGFPNKPIGSVRSPRLGTVRIGQSGEFVGGCMIETQPLPIRNGRNLTALLLLVGGGMLSAAGAWILLYDTGLRHGPFAINQVVPALAAGIAALSAGKMLFATAWSVAHTFRFQSELIRIDVCGTYTVDRLGAGDGRGGLMYAESIAVQSNTRLTIEASKMITEACAPRGSWNPVADALRAPRIIVDTVLDPEFESRLHSLSEALRSHQAATNLPGVNTTDTGLQNLLNINQAITHAQESTRLSHLNARPAAITHDTTHQAKA